MSLLLDSHVLLWALAGEESRLPPTARRAIERPARTVVVSAASVWEVEIKRALGKVDLPDDLTEALAAGAYVPLAISLEHAVVAARLPPHHRDPFDRMLVAQAIVEGLTLVTSDQRIARYEVPVLWE